MGYYFISIGGSGARVLESLTHLCVAGLFPNKAKSCKLYVMAVDPDTGNGNLNRTQTLLSCWDKFQGVDVGKGTPLLKTELTLPNPYVWSPAADGNNNSKNDLNTIASFAIHKNSPVGMLFQSLYTYEERSTDLKEGFRGRPSIGAAVMTQQAISNDAAWQKLTKAIDSDVKKGDGWAYVFLAGSVFGGTGAAGLPTIARLLRGKFDKYCANQQVRIGGALLLPYFSFELDDDAKKPKGIFASSNQFRANTKAALRYYADTAGEGYDAMYFVGDNVMKPMPVFDIGGKNQCNDAHIVDMFAAMAAIHFYSNIGKEHYYCISRSVDTDFAWSDLPNVTLNDMNDGQGVPVRERFVQFVRFVFAYLHAVKPVLRGNSTGKEAPWYNNYLKDVDVNGDEALYFEKYAELFVTWLYQTQKSAEPTRTVNFIKPEAFAVKNDVVDIDRDAIGKDDDFFKTIDYNQSNVSIDEVLRRFNDDNSSSWWKKIFGGENEKKSTPGTGYGLVLRRLYDCCAVRDSE